MAITNVERQTLRQWIKRGLLPPAKLVSDGNGVKSRWPRGALEQARFIKEMRAQLYSLDEILPMVLERWGAPPTSTRAAAAGASADRASSEGDQIPGSLTVEAQAERRGGHRKSATRG